LLGDQPHCRARNGLSTPFRWFPVTGLFRAAFVVLRDGGSSVINRPAARGRHRRGPRRATSAPLHHGGLPQASGWPLSSETTVPAATASRHAARRWAGSALAGSEIRSGSTKRVRGEFVGGEPGGLDVGGRQAPSSGRGASGPRFFPGARVLSRSPVPGRSAGPARVLRSPRGGTRRSGTRSPRRRRRYLPGLYVVPPAPPGRSRPGTTRPPPCAYVPATPVTGRPVRALDRRKLLRRGYGTIREAACVEC
jgi:hypothetical protein